MTTENKTFCVLPWIHFAIKPDGLSKPCCRFQTWDAGNGVSEEQRNWHELDHNIVGTQAVVNSNQFEEIRQVMLKGKKVSGCWKCYKEEEHAGYSMRTAYNEMYPAIDVNKPALKYLEVSFGNYCNLSCRTCNSGLSTTWYDDDKKLEGVYDTVEAFPKIIDIPFSWNTEDFNSIEEIKFVGGEPMLNPNFPKFLETVLATGRGKDITLIIFSNTSWFPKDKTIELLKKFKKVYIWMSIDSYGSRNDYIRNKSQWSVVDSCAQKWLDLEKDTGTIGTVLTPTLNFLNIFSIDKLIDWWLDNRKKRNLNFLSRHSIDERYNGGDIVFSSVYHPEEYSLKNVPNKKELINKFKHKQALSIKGCDKNEVFVISRMYSKIIRMLHKDLDADVDLIPIIQHTKDLDLLRSQDFKTTLPEVYRVIKQELQKNNLSYEEINGRLDA